ncbi:MAG TPA: ABC transporter ATP-binding protein [Candidatus Paceibacterota bacterium]|jgi:NitT/TauT family transport system ATP-binding protein|nr:ABC transporter ATP-binding protein [Candidatus Paceibacterota bacterium]
MQNNKETIISTSNIFYTYLNEESGEHFNVLRDISLSVNSGEFVSLVGPSGCGKSTLLRILSGLTKAKRGNVISKTKKIAMVFQNFALFPWLSVKENIEFGLKMEGIKKIEREKIVAEKIREVGLSGFENKYPVELSGGMKQRVGIARALAVSPDLLLMDEPFSSLDVLTAEKLRAELLDIWLKYKVTIIMVTHLVEEAVELSDRIFVFAPRPTFIKDVIEVRIPRPRNERSKEYYDLVDKIAKQIE